MLSKWLRESLDLDQPLELAGVRRRTDQRPVAMVVDEP
jgi:hypothetical protein